MYSREFLRITAAHTLVLEHHYNNIWNVNVCGHTPRQTDTKSLLNSKCGACSGSPQ